MADSIVETDGHCIHLRALVCQEQDVAYQRHDYLSHEWQIGLWRDEVKGSMELVDAMSQPRQSPSSVINSPSSSCATPDAPSDICVRWRETIIEWKYQVVDRFDLSREVVSISTFYLDQYLSKHYVDEELFQLVAMASIYLAVKIHSPRKVTIENIASTGNGLITVKHIEDMEFSIMKCLDWHLHPPTSVSFIENFFPLISKDCSKVADSLEFSRFLSELGVCSYPLVTAKPSSIAIAAVLYSFEYFGLPEETQEVFQALAESASLDMNTPEVEACGKLLRRVYMLAMPNDSSAIGR